ncbi:DUF2891 domain-containing protein [Actinoallomurus sp. CA-142502]|uniref:DUF2891 domain-containing protein n=1 Tax=Actinoallomurus sp. CA-142502 TaxID=3239885 RepID=UPI003D94CF79
MIQHHERQDRLAGYASDFAEVALANIVREYPHVMLHTMSGPEDRPRPRDVNPAFYGSFDWHSCVEMHWLLIRLLRTASEQVPGQRIRAALDRHLAAEPLAAEAAYMGDPDRGIYQRPYGWGWTLWLIHETATWDDPDARRWTTDLTPLADVLTQNYLRWLPKATYPVRYGVHSNTAFGLSRALPYARHRARHGDGTLLTAITEKAHHWYGGDRDYPAQWEPAGVDFLSPALVEAELMTHLLPRDRFADWLDGFLPRIADRQPANLFTPATVSDSTDGYIAHLHGLNLSRAWCWRRLAETLGDADPRTPAMLQAAQHHADAALTHATGSHYAVEHWLACYAVLLLT